MATKKIECENAIISYRTEISELESQLVKDKKEEAIAKWTLDDLVYAESYILKIIQKSVEENSNTPGLLSYVAPPHAESVKRIHDTAYQIHCCRERISQKTNTITQLTTDVEGFTTLLETL